MPSKVDVGLQLGGNLLEFSKCIGARKGQCFKIDQQGLAVSEHQQGGFISYYRLSNQLSGLPASYIKTLTFDNDKVCQTRRNCQEIIDANIYFTRPYISQDKGTLKN